jgi:hypothetical protein
MHYEFGKHDYYKYHDVRCAQVGDLFPKPSRVWKKTRENGNYTFMGDKALNKGIRD